MSPRILAAALGLALLPALAASGPASASSPASGPASASHPASGPASASHPASGPASASHPASGPASASHPASGPASASHPASGPASNGLASVGHTVAAGSLDILLTNDDGYRAGTLAAMKQALTAAGHRVTVSAPCTDQSGKGTSQAANYPRGAPTEENTIVVRRPAPDTWAVCGSPSDAVLFGVQHAFPVEPPDLVVSGINPGHNTGAVANHSGTVGAAVMAGELTIPAIAVSVEIDITSSPPRLGSVSGAAAYTVRLIARLQRTASSSGLLPRYVSLNVNYPVADHVRGTKVTSTGRKAFVRPNFQPTPLCQDCYLVLPKVDPGPDPVADSDNNALAADYIAVVPLDGDWTAPSGVRTELRYRLTELT
ncbi:MAG: 5'/3'-nucleotidase SurE [Micromonosporaceae bacterium]